MIASATIQTCSADGRTFLANKAGQPAAYGNRKQAQGYADKAETSGGWIAQIEPAGGRFRVALVFAESLNPGAELAESPAPIEREVTTPVTAGPWTESEAGVWDHASGRATVTGTTGGKWVVILDGSMLVEGKATRYFRSAEVAMGAAEDEMAEPAEKPAPRSLKVAKPRKATVTPAQKPERATGGLTAGKLAAQTKGPDRLREIARKAAATRAARRAAMAQIAA